MSIELGATVGDCCWSEEFDCIPLRLRWKMLHSHQHQKRDECLHAEVIPTTNCSSTALSTQDSDLPIHQASDSGPTFLPLDNSSGHSVDCYGDSDFDRKFEIPSISSHIMPISAAGADIEQLNDPVGAYLRQLSGVPGNVLQDHLMGSSSAHVQANGVKHEMLYEFDNALDNILLKERRKMLLSRKHMHSTRSDIGENDNGELSNLSKVMLHSADSDFSRDTLIAKNINFEVNGCDDLASENATDETIHTFFEFLPPLPVTAMGDDCALANSDLPPLAKVKDDLPPLAKVKDEPLDINELCNEGNNFVLNSFIDQTLTVKNEPGFSGFLQDELDHMPLIDRIKLLSSEKPSLDVSRTPVCLKEDVASALDLGNDVLKSVKPVSISRPRKKRRTATDSVETALEEDAPGLLKVLLDKGVSPDEIKLYGEEDSDDAIDESFSEDSFAELEAVILQLFSQRQSFLKFPLLSTKGDKISYCLSCLLSLVEQTRYMRNRKLPVEWGWCRDLQSFIFVFQRHNRIVLERPEYGFATYFFELLNSVPVAWQIKRLVTAMKLTSCGRITVIENKPLVVGEDLNEGEARVLAEYGWTPNTGLGTMLNYCDRVVHDRKQELDSSEWRMKIGRQLMNGYNGGNIVAQNLPKRLTECQDSQNVQVKLEEWTV